VTNRGVKDNLDATKNYQADGYLIIKNYLDSLRVEDAFGEVLGKHDQVLELILKMLDVNLMDKGDFSVENGKIRYLKFANVYFKTINSLIDTNLNLLAANLLGEKAFVDGVELHQKYPGSSGTPPHQDNFYFCLQDAKALTVYIPLNHQTKKNGALAVLPGSHRIDFDHFSSSVPGFSSGCELTEEQEAGVFHYTLKQGDVSVHHCNIVHMAASNSSETPRINVAVRFRAVNEKIDPIRKIKYDSFKNSSTRVA
jgi:ectoine hydroxylase-related dioxygenase (phytanoyl-CoA dioxygenase family)